MLNIYHRHSTRTRSRNPRNASVIYSKKRHSRRGKLKATVEKALRQLQLDLQTCNVRILTAGPSRLTRRRPGWQTLDHRLHMASLGQHHAKSRVHPASVLILDHSVAKKSRTRTEGARTCRESTQSTLSL